MSKLLGFSSSVETSWRSIVARPALSLVLVLTLAAGAAGATVLFDLVKALRFVHTSVPSDVVMITGMDLSPVARSEEGFYYGLAGLEMLRRNPAFAQIAGQVATSGNNAAYRPRIVRRSGVAEPEVLGVTTDYFSVVGVPIQGRDFTPSDDAPGSAPVAIISERLRNTAFASLSTVFGSTLDAGTTSITIVGVAAPRFSGVRLGEQVDVWIPQHLVAELAPARRWGADAREPNFLALGRLRPGTNAAAAENALRHNIDPSIPAFAQGTTVLPVSRLYGSSLHGTILVRPDLLLYLLMGGAGLVLLAGCTTSATLLVIAYENRRHELAVRVALGGTPTEVRRLLTTELGAITFAAVCVALLLTSLASHALRAVTLAGVDLSRVDLSIDWRVMSFSFAATSLALWVSARHPLRRLRSLDIVHELGSRAPRYAVSTRRFRHSVVMLHSAVTTLVLVCAWTLVHTVHIAMNRRPGFDIDQVVYVNVTLQSPYAPSTSRKSETTRAEGQLRAAMLALQVAPGISAVALGPAPNTVVVRPSITIRTSESIQIVSCVIADVTDNYFAVLGTPLLTGRPFGAYAGADALREVVVTESLAKRLWPKASAVGEVFSFAGSSIRQIVVGVVRDVELGSFANHTTFGLFRQTTPTLAAGQPAVELAIRSPASAVLTIESVLLAVMPESTRLDVVPAREFDRNGLAQHRLAANLFAASGIIALMLGVAGVFGLVTFTVREQFRDIGVRLALGGRFVPVVSRLLATSLWSGFVGVLAGLMLAILLWSYVAAKVPGIHVLGSSRLVVVFLLISSLAFWAGVIATIPLRRLNLSDLLRRE